MKGFVIYPTYRLINGKAYVFLFGRLENGESFLTISHFRPYFYIKKQDLKKALKLEEFECQNINFKTFAGKPVVKITLNLPGEVPKLKSLFEDNNIQCFEADIRFPYRFMIDNSIQGSLDIDGDYESNEYIDRIYRDPEISKASYYPKNLKILSLDIETNAQASEIYSIALVTDSYENVLITSKKKLKNALSFNSEFELLNKFQEIFQDIDPDIITGWNLIDFDFRILQERFAEYGLPFILGRDNTPCRLRFEKSYFRTSKADFSGRIVIDALHLLRISFIKVDDYKLDTVAQKILGDKKLVLSENKNFELKDLYKDNPQKLVDYNLKDAELVLRIIKKTDVLKLSISRSLITGMPLDRVNASIASLDSLYIRKTRERNLVVPSSSFKIKENPITGGFVRESEPGIYDYLLILDFKSLYPSIMKTFNIDPASFVPSGKGKNLVKSPNNACFKNQDGILPDIITEIWVYREQARKDRDELTRWALKILLNSFFGVLASPNCRFFNLKMANAITHFAQSIIKLTSKKIEEKGYQVIYSDTDSNFVVSNAKSLEEADKIGNELQDYINNFYKDYTKKVYKRESFLEMEYEKCFIKFLMPRIRKSETGAKKRYAGLVMKDGKEKIEFTGLEAVRSDWTDLSKKFQLELYNKIFHDKEVSSFIRNFVRDLVSGKYDDLLVYKKSLRKGLAKYTKTTPPHVKAARKLDIIENNLVEYVITEDGPEPLQCLRHAPDYKHYIEKQIKPVADSILVFFNKSFDGIVSGSKQTDLSSFR